MESVTLANPNVQLLLYWMRERQSIYIKKLAGKRKPWTTDPILQAYRFCNVYREQDTVTQWVGERWRKPHAHDPKLWFAMVVARLVNWPPTLQVMGYPYTGEGQAWRSLAFVQHIHAIQEAGQKAYGGAYIVSTNGNAMDKAEYLAERVLGPLWKHRRDAPGPDEPLFRMHTWLMHFDGMGSFMAAQVVADIKYASPWLAAKDWTTFAASGPGSRRGLNRVLGRPVDAPWNEQVWHTTLTILGRVVNKNLPPNLRALGVHMQDLQNCLCEFDKYMRVKLGEGRPRSLYPGK